MKVQCATCCGTGVDICDECEGTGISKKSDFVIEWARKFEEQFPLLMAEAEMTKDFSARKLEYSVDLLGFIEDLIEDFNLRRRKA